MPQARLTSLTSARGIGPLVEIIEKMASHTAAERVFRQHGIPLELYGEPDRKLPMADLIGLYETAARATGNHLLGFHVGQHMVGGFGPWVDYALGGPTLETFLKRASRAIRLHQSGTLLTLKIDGDQAIYSYVILADAQARGVQHQDHTIPALLGAFRCYLGPSWRPDRIDVKGPYSGRIGLLEDALQTSVVAGSPALSFVFPTKALATPRQNQAPSRQLVVFSDLVSMGRKSPRVGRLTDVVVELIQTRLVGGWTGIDGLARQLGMGPRTLQRKLSVEGENYRELLRRARMQRALFLLQETEISIAIISDTLGYSDPAHFTRSFRNHTGLTPLSFRRIAKAAE